MSIEVAVRHHQGSFTLDVSFASAGRLTALFGPSGSGKSSIINVIAGLIRPRTGRIVVAGHTLVDSQARLFVPAHRRRIGYVFQDARLFPHLTVRQNLLYGAFFARSGIRRQGLADVVDLLAIAHLLDRRPAKLSGGEKQRVALGRALLSDPELMLMDEPLAALDEARKSEILPYIERLRDEVGLPIVYVSHSIAEVARLATDVVVLREGRVVASGGAAEVLERTELLGADARGESGALLNVELIESDEAISRLRSRGVVWRVPRLSLPNGSRLRVRVRARDVMLATSEPKNISALNIHRGTIETIVDGADGEVLVRIAMGDDHILARVTRYSADTLALRPGLEVFAVVKAVSFTDRNQPAAKP